MEDLKKQDIRLLWHKQRTRHSFGFENVGVDSFNLELLIAEEAKKGEQTIKDWK